MSATYRDVVLAAPVSIPYVRFSDKSANYWLGRALAALAKAGGLSHTEFDGLSVSSFTLAPDTAATLTQHFGLTPRFLSHEVTGGASGVTALRKAARAVQTGDANIVACLSGDTNPKDGFVDLLENFSSDMGKGVLPYGAGGPNVSFALITDAYMCAHGATREDFGRLAVAQRQNGLSTPHALIKKPLSLEAYLDARPIAAPLHLYDCVMPCAGAEGFLVMHKDKAEALALPYVHIRGSIERHNAYHKDDVQLRTGLAMDAEALWRQAGLAPQDMDFVQTYDDYPVICFMQLEDLGFCEKGQAHKFVGAHDLTIGGDFPHNTSGGQLSCGQAGAAGGFLGLVEGIRQLTGTALGGQVKNARYGLVSGFGIINYDKGLSCGAVVLERGQ